MDAATPTYTADQQARWLSLAMVMEERPRFTDPRVAAQVAAALSAAGWTCRVGYEPHFVSTDEIRLGPLACVSLLDDDDRVMGYPNEAIWDADQAAISARAA